MSRRLLRFVFVQRSCRLWVRRSVASARSRRRARCYADAKKFAPPTERAGITTALVWPPTSRSTWRSLSRFLRHQHRQRCRSHRRAAENGVPDFVEGRRSRGGSDVSKHGLARGFRQMLDDSVYHDRPDFGGDGRFDIYLRWAGKGSDGIASPKPAPTAATAKSGPLRRLFRHEPKLQRHKLPDGT